MQRISALTMRKKFGHYLDLVAEEKEPVLIERANRPMAVLVPAEDYETYERWMRDRAARDEAVRRMDKLRTELGERLGPVDVVALVRKTRDSR